MQVIKAYLDTPLVWWLAVLGAIGVMSMLIWSILDEPAPVAEKSVDEVAISEPAVVDADEPTIVNDPATSYVYWPDSIVGELLSEEGEVILNTAQIYLSERDTGSWSYIFDRYNYPFALVTVEDDEKGPEFNFELLLKDIDEVWQVIFETSTVGEVPPESIIDTYQVPVITELN